jgi:hypothetical protein
MKGRTDGAVLDFTRLPGSMHLYPEGDTAREAGSLVGSMTAADRLPAIPVSRLRRLHHGLEQPALTLRPHLFNLVTSPIRRVHLRGSARSTSHSSWLTKPLERAAPGLRQPCCLSWKAALLPCTSPRNAKRRCYREGGAWAAKNVHRPSRQQAGYAERQQGCTQSGVLRTPVRSPLWPRHFEMHKAPRRSRRH